MTKYLQTKPGSIEEIAAKMSSQVNEDEYKQLFKKELEKAGKGIGAMTPAEKKAFFNKVDSKYKAKNEAVNPYAVGMAAAMKQTGDTPPLKKSTITKAHDIAKSIEKKEQASGKEIDVFHKKLDKLVHKSFGHSSDEKNMKKEDKEVPKGYHKMPDGTIMKDSEHKKDKNEEVKEARSLADLKKMLDSTTLLTKAEKEKAKEKEKNMSPDAYRNYLDNMFSEETLVESDAYDNDRFAIVNGKAKIDNSNSSDRSNHVYAPNAKTAEAMYKAGVKKFLDTTAMRNKFPTYKEENEIEETHSFVTNKQNEKQKDAKGEKDIVDPKPKLKLKTESTAKQHSLLKSIYDVWANSANELEEVKKSAKYFKSEEDKEEENEEAVKEANINMDNIKKGDSAKEKELKIKLDKEKDTDALEKQLVAAQAQIGLLKQKLENEKHKAIKPLPNKETGEVPLTVGVAYKHLKDKMAKEEDNKKKTMVGTNKTPVETKPTVDYKM